MSLLELPAELLIQVASHLNTTGFCSLRASCKEVAGKLLDTFGKEFFSKRQFMIGRFSLEALVQISAHPVLSKYLNHVIISLSGVDCDPDGPSGPCGHETDKVLMSTGAARDMLVSAFSNLSDSLQTVGIRNYDARSRVRDGQLASWKSYGWSNYTDSYLYRLDRIHFTGREIFALVLVALAKSRARPIAFEVLFSAHCPRLNADAFRIIHGYHGPEVRRVLTQFRRLTLNLGIDRQFELCHLLDFLSCMPQLSALRLNDQIGSYRSSDDLLHKLAPTIAQAECIQTLELGFMVLGASQLSRALLDMPLRAITLWNVVLAHDYWGSASLDASVQHQTRHCVHSWKSLLQSLAESSQLLHKLHTFSIGRLGERCRELPNQTYSTIRHLRFSQPLATPSWQAREVTFQKQNCPQDLATWLTMMAGSIVMCEHLESPYPTGLKAESSESATESDGLGPESVMSESDGPVPLWAQVDSAPYDNDSSTTVSDSDDSDVHEETANSGDSEDTDSDGSSDTGSES